MTSACQSSEVICTLKSALTDEDARALVYVRETLSIDNAAYRHLNQVDVLNASQHLRRFRDQGLLEQRGKGSATYYVPTLRFLETLAGGKSSPGGQDPASLAEQSKAGAIPDLVKAIPDSNGGVPDSNPPLGASTLPEDLQARIAALGAKPRQEPLRQVILALCSHQPFGAQQLATLLGRAKKHLINDHLSEMVAQGDLELTLPQQPNHPRQAYRAASTKEEVP